MELVELSVVHKGRSLTKKVSKEVVILRRMRIFRRINRKDAAKALERGEKVIERFENGRAPLTEEQKKALVRRYRYTCKNLLLISLGKLLCLSFRHDTHSNRRVCLAWKAESIKKSFLKKHAF